MITLDLLKYLARGKSKTYCFPTSFQSYCTMKLSSGALKEISVDSKHVDKPIFQLLALKKIGANSGSNDRYRLLLSDGQHSYSAMLGTQLNSLVNNNQLQPKTIVQLDKYICNTIGDTNKKVMIVLEVSILDQPNEKIGNPQPLSSTNQQQQNQAAPAPAPAQTINKPVPKFQGGSSNKPAGNFYSNAPTTPGGTPAKAQPIASLTPYQNRWTIKARVTNKTAIRRWNNSRGEGELFSMDLVDQSGEIRATAFKEQCQKYYDLIQIGKVYLISKCGLKPANKQYTSIDNDYEMTFNHETIVQPVDEDVEEIPGMQFNFRKIDELENCAKDTILDVIGVVKSAGDCTTIMTRNSQEVAKRDVQLVDDSERIVNLTLWREQAETFDASNNPVLAIKGAKVSDFGGRSLNLSSGAVLQMNPDIPRAHQLKGWYDNVGYSKDMHSISEQRGGGGGGSANWMTIKESQNLGQGEKPDYFTMKGTIMHMKSENCLYKACPEKDCNKKLLDNGDNTYRCEKCSKTCTDFKYRLILQSYIHDCTGSVWVTSFQDTAEYLLGQNASYLGQLKEDDSDAFNRVFTEALFKSYIFKMRIKMETYNEESRLKNSCISAAPVDFKEYSRRLITEINKLAIM
ncbi:replication protein A 70 kDa DNA-binding subunit-like [Anneissia japonica]|uniref:replication protein A 70 kDa DNA-binding subunit-like n=1 Tax=Anneissia japonica TaxID=1529436 RepID=UPI001425B331|nr:replication protein A 70 kDa DNA-binding subunit-like [Anneissia japonica]